MKSGTLSFVKLQTCFCLKRVQPSQDVWVFCRCCCSLACLLEGGNLGVCHQVQWQHNSSSLLLICWLNSLHNFWIKSLKYSECLPCIMGPSLKQSFQNCVQGGPNREWDIMLGSRQQNVFILWLGMVVIYKVAFQALVKVLQDTLEIPRSLSPWRKPVHSNSFNSRVSVSKSLSRQNTLMNRDQRIKQHKQYNCLFWELEKHTQVLTLGGCCHFWRQQSSGICINCQKCNDCTVLTVGIRKSSLRMNES